jgi:PRA1 family protein
MLGSMFKKENLRGPSVFFGIGEERPYYVEKTPSLLAERLRHNFTFFYLNYLLIAAILFCLTLVIHVSTLIGLALLAGSWMWLIRATQDGNLRIGSTLSTVCVRSKQIDRSRRLTLYFCFQVLAFLKRQPSLLWVALRSLR